MIEAAPLPEGWARAVRALEVFAVDPGGVGGLWLAARAGPARERWLAGLAALVPGAARLHPSVGDEALFGGLDLTATLAGGRPVMRAGVLRGGEGVGLAGVGASPDLRVIVLAMAERCPPSLAARLGPAMDAGQAVVAQDEAAGEGEGLPGALAERLGIFVALDGLPLAGLGAGPDTARVDAARGRLAQIEMTADQDAALVQVAARLAIGSVRPVMAARAVARANAALDGRAEVADADMALAVALTLAHRGILPPEAEDTPPPPPSPPDDAGEGDGRDQQTTDIPDEILLEAVRAALPPDLLDRLKAGRAARAAAGSGAGAARRGNRRGRPLPPRAGRLGGGARIDLVATLRQAAPLQAIRAAATGVPGLAEGGRLQVRADDIRLKRYEERSDRLLVFLVDASGSAALARLAEAKGAVELLLAEAYVRRDHVALVAFRGTGAEVLLPPTRSLVQTKRRLAGLPGGGGTPLAAGLRAGISLAIQARARGMTPTIAMLTDGRVNIALDGRADRAAAEADASAMARAVMAAGLPGIVIDSGNRANPALAALAKAMGAAYVPLPRADAGRVSAVVSAAMAQ